MLYEMTESLINSIEHRQQFRRRAKNLVMLKAVLKSSAKRINSHRGKGIISKVYGKQIRLGDHTVKENEEDITPHLRMSQKKKMTRNEFDFKFRLFGFFGC